jgi:uncharacterized RDD family membrane protein YckC
MKKIIGADVTLRAYAYVIDLVVCASIVVIGLVLKMFFGGLTAGFYTSLEFFIFLFIVHAVYNIGMLSSHHQGTLGMTVMDLKAIDYEGQPWDILEAGLHYVGHLVGLLTLTLGFFSALRDPHHLTLYDRLTHTTIVHS